MKLVDANVLLHAANEASDDHALAKSWLLEALAGDETVGLSWVVTLAFLRLSTLASAFPRPLEVREAVEVIGRWAGAPPAEMVHPTGRHMGVLTDLLAHVGSGGNLVNDVHLAALAIEHGAEVVSFDYDFARFPGLRWRLPGEERSRRNPG